MFAPEGYTIIAAASALGALLVGGGLWWGGWPGAVLVLLGVAAIGFTLYFFRDPSRTPPSNAADVLLAPADGKVVEIVEEEDSLYLKGPARRVSIFLSPLNVHVNRVPATGEIEYVNYEPGEYLVAWHPKASDKNERSELGLRHAGTGTKVLFKQIAGAVARRIVYHLGEGDRVEAGARFGLVKFGSRMDVLVPPAVPLSVEVGDRVRAGETVLGRLSGASPSDEAASQTEFAPAPASDAPASDKPGQSSEEAAPRPA